MMYDDTSTTEANMTEMNDIDDSPEKAFSRKTVLYLIDNVVTGLTVSLSAAKKLAKNFVDIYHNVRKWVRKKAKCLSHQYTSYLSDEYLADEMQHLPVVDKTNFGKPELKALELLNLLT